MTILRLLAWLSPAFPTGGYAWSHGMEWAVDVNDVHDGASLLSWVSDVLWFGAGRNDAIVTRLAHSATDSPALLTEIVEISRASAASRERHAEAVGMGNAFRLAASAWNPVVLDAIEGDLPYPVAVGALAGANGIGGDDAVLGVLQAFAAGMISAAVRLVPLGQSTGLAVLAALEPVITAVAEETRHATPDDLGGACFRSDIASLRHETQCTRLFRS